MNYCIPLTRLSNLKNVTGENIILDTQLRMLAGHYSLAAKTHLGGEPCFVRYSSFMIDYKRLRHAFSENAK